jgi:hypothetical protein
MLIPCLHKRFGRCLQFELNITMTQIFSWAFLALTILSLASFSSPSNVDRSSQFYNHKKPQPLGISIVLYRVGKADKIDDLSNIEKQIDKSKSVNLYKITQDLGIIFMNTADPYNDTKALPYKMLFGTYVEKQVGDRVINGFISTMEVSTICDWIKKYQVDSYDGFSKLYDNLSKEAKQELDDIGADDKKSLFNGYVQPLTQFYLAALKDKNSIIICGE